MTTDEVWVFGVAGGSCSLNASVSAEVFVCGCVCVCVCVCPTYRSKDLLQGC